MSVSKTAELLAVQNRYGMDYAVDIIELLEQQLNNANEELERRAKELDEVCGEDNKYKGMYKTAMTCVAENQERANMWFQKYDSLAKIHDKLEKSYRKVSITQPKSGLEDAEIIRHKEMKEAFPPLTIPSTPNPDSASDLILSNAMGNLSGCMVIGWEKDTGAMYTDNTIMDGGDCLWLLEQCKTAILGGDE